MKHALSAAIVVLATSAHADETRELDAHEHGVGALNIAVDGKRVALELHAPGADIVGFEYEAKSAEDRAAIDAAVAVLAKPLELFVFPAAAECSVTQASAALISEDDDHDHSKHVHDDDHDHDHEEHADEHGHKDHDDHGHDDHAEAEGSHTEFQAEYLLMCNDPGALSSIEFAYFETFKNALELEVQIVSASGAQAFEVEREAPSLDLRGMF